MSIQALGYLGVGGDKLEDWTNFATNWLGMQAVDRGAGVAAFRMDDRKQRLVIDRSLPEGRRYFGWEVVDAAALEALAVKLEAAGVAVRHERAALADQRLVRGLVSFSDPVGNRLEAFHGAQIADAPFQPGRTMSGFRTGAQGMGHALLLVPDAKAALAFYRDLLGFRISDYMADPVNAYFLHVNPRHHSIALVQAPVNRMHHLMVELYSLDDVGAGYDLTMQDPTRVVATLGRHSNDLMTSFYQRTPSDIYVEYGWGGREVDDAVWQPHPVETLASYWGHKGLFEALGDGDHPPPMRRPSERAPLQVMDGNYQRMRGVCPWWDAVKGSGA
jgi:2,3-dihydroxybiphenyl 1,2-dioxygenase